MKQIILLDLDKTVFDNTYSITDQRILGKISQMQEMGWEIGLNSDTPQGRLINYAKNLGVEGLIISEMGNCIYSQEQLLFLWRNNDNAGKFMQMELQFISDIMQQGVADIIYGNATNYLKWLVDIKSDFEYIVLIHRLRQCSFAFYLRHVTEKGFQLPDKKVLLNFARVAHDKYVEIFQTKKLIFDVNSEYGICIIHTPDSYKAKATKILQKKFGYERIFMIGDSMSDFLADSNIVQLGVSNASIEYGQRCDFVATKSYSSGVIQCLDWIANEYSL